MKRTLVITVILNCLLIIGCKSYSVSSIEGDNKEISNSIVTDSIAENIISKYRISLDNEMSVVLNTIDEDMHTGAPQGILGNFVADLTYKSSLQWKSNSDYSDIAIDFALLNNGGLRVPLFKGDVTVGRVFELMPFENEIVLVKISGAKMAELISFIVSKSKDEGRKSGVPFSKELEIKILKSNKTTILINNAPFDSRRDYIIATSDYLANGGDKMDFFLNPLKIVGTGIKLRDAILNEIKDLKQIGKSVSADLDTRISYE